MRSRFSHLLVMKQTTKDNLIYLAVALAIVTGVVFYAFYTERMTGKVQEIPGPILWGILSTPVIIALILERYWEHRRQRWLLVIAMSAALTNILAMFVAYSFRWDPPVMVWVVITVLWIIAAFILADKVVLRSRR